MIYQFDQTGFDKIGRCIFDRRDECCFMRTDNQNEIGPEDAGAYDSVQAGIVDAIADWCEALHGNVPLADAVAQLVRGLGAEAGMLVRTNLNECRSVQVARFDERDTKSSQPLSSNFGDELFGSLLKKSRPATVWLASRHTDRFAAELAFDYCQWREARRMQEFAVLVLSSGASTRDHLEFHFREPLSMPAYAALGIVLPAMARTWASRQIGLITKASINQSIHHFPAKPRKSSYPILSVSNPAHLSRAEFRVCLLLSRGLSVAGVCAELSLADTTVRSHLRNIYAKSETSSLAELIYCLIRPDSTSQDISAVSA